MNKISVMMLDDDRLALNHLCRMVDWASLGYEEPVCCTSFMQARQAWDKGIFQLCILDIEVPGGNGLDFAQQIRTEHPGTFVMMLTAYREFHYARKAVTVGAFDYLIKHELTGDILTDRLLAVREQIANRRQNRRLMQETALCMLLTDQTRQDKLCKMLDMEGKALTLFGLWQPLRFGASQPPVSLWPALEEYLRQTGAVACSEEQRLWILCGAEDRQALRPVLENLETLLRPTGVDAARSEVFFSARHVGVWRGCCIRAGEERFLQGAQPSLRLARPMPQAEMPLSTAAVLNAWQRMEQEAVEGALAQWKREILCRAKPMKDLEELFHLLQERCNLPPNGAFESLAEAMTWLEKTSRAGLAEQQRLCNVSPLTQEILKWIHKHPGGTIQDMAEDMHRSAGYLRAAFKKDMNQTVADYMTTYKLRQAKRMLTVERMKVHQVAAALHYQSAQYFSYVFRRETGMTPMQFVQAWEKGEIHEQHAD